MKRLSKEKQQHLILAVLFIGMILAGLWLGLVRFQKSSLQANVQSRDKAKTKLAGVKQTIANAGQLEAQLEEGQKRIAVLEENMASGDLYAWSINMIRNFKTPYRVEIPQFSQVDGPKSVNLIPDYPYQQASLTIGGTGNYNDIGRFVADFENTFPYMRVLNLSVEPSPSLQSNDKEKLSFKMDIAMLVKPSA